uniref:Uncharacterized protein n=1 Tax=Chromera velia CCMP2878 TaxID=1169474 RepID=A0A0G4F5X7_9ALVE|eukprot:Cvel_15226.t1-p1 / transcript=Cvel_15226.t1 / gene=Cvel_15226 / organism=Chromera_velia_CCMP2878 / gene_product=hypothetical protein / transcript_product=hypothetical protein / location=Cvel_scaffold1114:12282-28190(+) / protein_length=2704 / sequence_SO=supercontig / SO=protein_coding / is_pseudo=false
MGAPKESAQSVLMDFVQHLTVVASQTADGGEKLRAVDAVKRGLQRLSPDEKREMKGNSTFASPSRLLLPCFDVFYTPLVVNLKALALSIPPSGSDPSRRASTALSGLTGRGGRDKTSKVRLLEGVMEALTAFLDAAFSHQRGVEELTGQLSIPQLLGDSVRAKGSFCEVCLQVLKVLSIDEVRSSDEGAAASVRLLDRAIQFLWPISVEGQHVHTRAETERLQFKNPFGTGARKGDEETLCEPCASVLGIVVSQLLDLAGGHGFRKVQREALCVIERVPSSVCGTGVMTSGLAVLASVYPGVVTSLLDLWIRRGKEPSGGSFVLPAVLGTLREWMVAVLGCGLFGEGQTGEEDGSGGDGVVGSQNEWSEWKKTVGKLEVMWEERKLNEEEKRANSEAARAQTKEKMQLQGVERCQQWVRETRQKSSVVLELLLSSRNAPGSLSESADVRSALGSLLIALVGLEGGGLGLALGGGARAAAWDSLAALAVDDGSLRLGLSVSLSAAAVENGRVHERVWETMKEVQSVADQVAEKTRVVSNQEKNLLLDRLAGMISLVCGAFRGDPSGSGNMVIRGGLESLPLPDEDAERVSSDSLEKEKKREEAGSQDSASDREEFRTGQDEMRNGSAPARVARLLRSLCLVEANDLKRQLNDRISLTALPSVPASATSGGHEWLEEFPLLGDCLSVSPSASVLGEEEERDEEAERGRERHSGPSEKEGNRDSSSSSSSVPPLFPSRSSKEVPEWVRRSVAFLEGEPEVQRCWTRTVALCARSVSPSELLRCLLEPFPDPVPDSNDKSGRLSKTRSRNEPSWLRRARVGRQQRLPSSSTSPEGGDRGNEVEMQGGNPNGARERHEVSSKHRDANDSAGLLFEKVRKRCAVFASIWASVSALCGEGDRGKGSVLPGPLSLEDALLRLAGPSVWREAEHLKCEMMAFRNRQDGGKEEAEASESPPLSIASAGRWSRLYCGTLAMACGALLEGVGRVGGSEAVRQQLSILLFPLLSFLGAPSLFVSSAAAAALSAAASASGVVPEGSSDREAVGALLKAHNDFVVDRATQMVRGGHHQLLWRRLPEASRLPAGVVARRLSSSAFSELLKREGEEGDHGGVTAAPYERARLEGSMGSEGKEEKGSRENLEAIVTAVVTFLPPDLSLCCRLEDLVRTLALSPAPSLLSEEGSGRRVTCEVGMDAADWVVRVLALIAARLSSIIVSQRKERRQEGRHTKEGRRRKTKESGPLGWISLLEGGRASGHEFFGIRRQDVRVALDEDKVDSDAESGGEDEDGGLQGGDVGEEGGFDLKHTKNRGLLDRGKYGAVRSMAQAILLGVRYYLQDERLPVRQLAHAACLHSVICLSTRSRELLPRLHALWPLLVPSFGCESPLAVTATACQVVKSAARASGDFLKERFASDVFRPLVDRLSLLPVKAQRERRSVVFKAQGGALDLFNFISKEERLVSPLAVPMATAVLRFFHVDADPRLQGTASEILRRLVRLPLQRGALWLVLMGALRLLHKPERLVAKSKPSREGPPSESATTPGDAVASGPASAECALSTSVSVCTGSEECAYLRLLSKGIRRGRQAARADVLAGTACSHGVSFPFQRPFAAHLGDPPLSFEEILSGIPDNDMAGGKGKTGECFCGVSVADRVVRDIEKSCCGWGVFSVFETETVTKAKLFDLDSRLLLTLLCECDSVAMPSVKAVHLRETAEPSEEAYRTGEKQTRNGLERQSLAGPSLSLPPLQIPVGGTSALYRDFLVSGILLGGTSEADAVSVHRPRPASLESHFGKEAQRSKENAGQRKERETDAAALLEAASPNGAAVVRGLLQASPLGSFLQQMSEGRLSGEDERNAEDEGEWAISPDPSTNILMEEETEKDRGTSDSSPSSSSPSYGESLKEVEKEFERTEGAKTAEAQQKRKMESQEDPLLELKSKDPLAYSIVKSLLRRKSKGMPLLRHHKDHHTEGFGTPPVSLEEEEHSESDFEPEESLTAVVRGDNDILRALELTDPSAAAQVDRYIQTSYLAPLYDRTTGAYDSLLGFTPDAFAPLRMRDPEVYANVAQTVLGSRLAPLFFEGMPGPSGDEGEVLVLTLPEDQRGALRGLLHLTGVGGALRACAGLGGPLSVPMEDDRGDSGDGAVLVVEEEDGDGDGEEVPSTRFGNGGGSDDEGEVVEIINLGGDGEENPAGVKKEKEKEESPVAASQRKVSLPGRSKSSQRSRRNEKKRNSKKETEGKADSDSDSAAAVLRSLSPVKERDPKAFQTVEKLVKLADRRGQLGGLLEGQPPETPLIELLQMGTQTQHRHHLMRSRPSNSARDSYPSLYKGQLNGKRGQKATRVDPLLALRHADPRSYEIVQHLLQPPPGPAGAPRRGFGSSLFGRPSGGLRHAGRSLADAIRASIEKGTDPRTRKGLRGAALNFRRSVLLETHASIKREAVSSSLSQQTERTEETDMLDPSQIQKLEALGPIFAHLSKLNPSRFSGLATALTAVQASSQTSSKQKEETSSDSPASAKSEQIAPPPPPPPPPTARQRNPAEDAQTLRSLLTESPKGPSYLGLLGVKANSTAPLKPPPSPPTQKALVQAPSVMNKDSPKAATAGAAAPVPVDEEIAKVLQSLSALRPSEFLQLASQLNKKTKGKGGGGKGEKQQGTLDRATKRNLRLNEKSQTDQEALKEATKKTRQVLKKLAQLDSGRAAQLGALLSSLVTAEGEGQAPQLKG